MHSLSIRNVSIVAMLCTFTMSCIPSNNEAGKINKTQVGTVSGAVVGGLLGSQIGRGSGNAAAITVGALAGGIIGHSIGAQMDEADIEAMHRAQQRALEYAKIGQQFSWKNPDTGISGYVIPTKTYVNHGRNCREYTQTVIISGKKQEAFGTACRRDDGSWEIIK